MAWALINSAIGGGSFDATGADILILAFTDNGAGDLTVQDSLGNVYTALTKYGGSGTATVRLSYKQAPTVSSTMTFSPLGSTGSVPQIFPMAFSGSAASPFEAENGAATNSALNTFWQPGPLTATNDNDLLVSALANAGSGAISIDSGFSLLQSNIIVGGLHYGGGIAWRVANIADGAIDPLWSWAGTNLAPQIAATQALFMGAAAGTGGGPVIGGSILHGAILRGGRIMG